MPFVGLWLASVFLMVWAAIDAATAPDSAWAAADQNKIVWIMLILFLPLVGAIAYLLAIRPKVRI